MRSLLSQQNVPGINAGLRTMVPEDGTMTSIEQDTSFRQVDPAEGNGHTPASANTQSRFGNGDSKSADGLASSEGSPFGVISSNSSPPASDEANRKRQDRAKIIVKRKVSHEESGRGRKSLSNKRHKAGGVSPRDSGFRHDAGELNGKAFPESAESPVSPERSDSPESDHAEPRAVNDIENIGATRQHPSQTLNPLANGGTNLLEEEERTLDAVVEQASCLDDTNGLRNHGVEAFSSTPSALQNGATSCFQLQEKSNDDRSETMPEDMGEVAASHEVKDVKIEAPNKNLRLVQTGREGAAVKNAEDKPIGAGRQQGPPVIAGPQDGPETPQNTKARRIPPFFGAVDDVVGASYPVQSQGSDPLLFPLPQPGVDGPELVRSAEGGVEDDRVVGSRQRSSAQGMKVEEIESRSREDAQMRRQMRDGAGDEDAGGSTDSGGLGETELDVEAADGAGLVSTTTGKLEVKAEPHDPRINERETKPSIQSKHSLTGELAAQLNTALKVESSSSDQERETPKSVGLRKKVKKEKLKRVDVTRTSALRALADAETNTSAGGGEENSMEENDVRETLARTLHIGDAEEHYLTPQIASRRSSRGFRNGGLRERYETNNLDSELQDSDGGSDDGDEDTCHDAFRTSDAQGSPDVTDEQEGMSRDGFGSHINAIRQRRSDGGWVRELESPEESLQSPANSSSSDDLDTLLEPPDDLDDKLIDVDIEDLSAELEEDGDAELPSKAESISGVKRIKIKLSGSGSPTKRKEARMPLSLLNIKEAPTTAKALLATGILAGFRVRYLDRYGKVLQRGTINKTGIVCECTRCKGKVTVNVSMFEKHAGSSARHPSDFIYLENGKNLHEVMEAGWKAAENGKKVSQALFEAMTLRDEKIDPNVCAHCRSESTELRCSRCSSAYHLECAGLSALPDGDWVCSQCSSSDGRRPPKINSLPLVREASTGKDSNANMHKALFVPGGLADDTEVAYYVKGQNYLTGVKRGSGILCACCNQVVSCSQFEQHAGWGSRRNPYSSIYLNDGQSLHIFALALDQRKGNNEKTVENLDYCTECGDGGDLVLCDNCPGAYHPECAGLISVPAGKWFCPRCTPQRGAVTGSGRKVTSKLKLRGGSRAGTASEDNCTRLLKAYDTVSSGCVFCKSGEFEKTGFGPRTILLCDQCEREYHVGCLKEHGLANLEELPEGEWFCSKDCHHIHGILRLLVGNGVEPLDNSIIHKVLESKSPHGPAGDMGNPELTAKYSWQLLHGRRGDPMNGKTLVQAAAIFSESFDPIVDESSGRDLIPLMVYSRNIRDQDFAGMHCVVLKENGDVVTAALVRIFGRQFAELPLVATKPGNTGKGLCKALILSIERLLGVLNVERLVLPAADGAEGIWVKKFSFSRLSDEESRRIRSEVQMMIFKGSSLLQKRMRKLNVTPKT